MVKEVATWVEKYSPKTIDDIAGQQVIKATIKKFIGDGGLPNMLFVGPAGTGKTSLALAIVHEVLGDDIYGNFAEFNASDDRSMDFLRKNVVQATKHATINGKRRIIFLDEADGILKEGMQLLRHPLGNGSQTSFIFAANDFDSFITPLTSRLMVFKFEPLSNEDIVARLKQIAESEKVDVNATTLKEIAKQSNGDLRLAINLLQQKAYAAEAELEELRKKYAEEVTE